MYSVEKVQVLILFSESCFSSSVRSTYNEVLIIHMLLTLVLSRIVLQYAVQWLLTSLRQFVIYFESLVVIHVLEPAIKRALYGVLWSLGIQCI